MSGTARRSDVINTQAGPRQEGNTRGRVRPDVRCALGLPRYLHEKIKEDADDQGEEVQYVIRDILHTHYGL